MSIGRSSSRSAERVSADLRRGWDAHVRRRRHQTALMLGASAAMVTAQDTDDDATASTRTNVH